MSDFQGLTADAFSTYAPEKWSSNVHNLARMKVKDTVVSLADRAEQALNAELEGLARATSDEIPNIINQKKVDAQWVYWFRDAEARESLASFLKKTPLDQATIFNIAPQDKHAILTAVVRHDHLWVGLRIGTGAAVDQKNLSAKLGKSWEREALLGLLAELPEGAACAFGDDVIHTKDLDDAKLAAHGETLSGAASAWAVGHSLTTDEAVALGPDLADHVGRWLGVCAPLYRFATWSPDNDHIAASKQIKEEKEEKRRRAKDFSAGDSVRVISGMFSGKRGTVESIDSKAKVRVRVGTMSVVVSGQDLVPVD